MIYLDLLDVYSFYRKCWSQGYHRSKSMSLSGNTGSCCRTKKEIIFYDRSINYPYVRTRMAEERKPYF